METLINSFIVIKLILWLLIAKYLGKYDAFMYHFRAYAGMHLGLDKVRSLEPHPTAFIMRVLICIGIGWNPSTDWKVCVSSTVLNIIAYALVFSYFHNGAYFHHRGLIDESLDYTYKTDKGKGSTSKIDFDYRTRLILMILGIGIWIGNLLIFLLPR